MRVAMVSEHASPLAHIGGEDAGGQNVHVAGLATALARQGADVVVYTRRDHPSLPRRVVLEPGVVVEHVDAGPPLPVPKDAMFPHMPEFASRLASEWRRRRPDLVHAHFWMSGYAALTGAHGLGIPVVQTFHALGSVKRRHQAAADGSPPERIDVERMILSTADHVIATCRDEVTELQLLDADVGRVSVIPCGVDLSVFRPDGPVEGRRPGMARLVSVGRLVERKGIADAITALARCADVELVVAGGPAPGALTTDSEIGRLTALARDAGVAQRVVLRGRLDRGDVARLMRSADMVVSVPWYEPFGMTPVEAMACGVPVLGSAVGGLLDTVLDTRTGVLVPPRDPMALAAAVDMLLGDPDLRAAMGRAGARRARQSFSWDRIGALTLQVYRRTLSGWGWDAPELVAAGAGEVSAT